MTFVRLWLMTFVVVCAVGGAAPAHAATVVQPGPGTLAVPSDADGRPQSFTVVASGFVPGASVSVEQCDGTSPTDSGWAPLGHCDNATAPAAVTVGADGIARFPAHDRNFGFTPFTGASPQSLFNCLAPGEPSPKNRLPDFTNCRIRVATSTTMVTADQAFASIRVTALRPGAPAIAPISETTTTTTAKSAVAAKDRATPTTTRARGEAVKRAARDSAGAQAPTVVLQAGGTARVGAPKSTSTKLTDALTSPAGIVLILLVMGLGVAAGRRASRRRALGGPQATNG
jgi:hypothetical protein